MLAGNRLIILLAMSVMLIVAGCKDSPIGNFGSGRIAFEDQSSYFTLDQCRIDTMPCAVVEARYPLAVDGPPDICQKINDTVFFHLRFSLALFATTVEDIPADLEEIAAQFFQEYRTMQEYQPGYLIPWKVSTTGKVLYQSPKTVSIRLDNYSFAGGAHPNTQTTILNFDLENGEIIDIEDLVANRGELERIVENAFKEAHHIESGTSVKQSGFFWGESFQLPDNFAILDEGLYFLYNPYEVAAYAMGPTDFMIPYDKLEGVVLRDRIF